MTEPVVRFSGVRKNFGPLAVLAGIDLTVASGRFVGLAGINGAGKTTLIKCLLDFCGLDGGDIRIHGLDHRNPQARRHLAFLPERFMPPYFLTGREFVRFMLRLSHTPYDESAVLAVFEELDLEPAGLDRPVRAYSKGMTQKLGLAACFLSQREFYVLDEPMSGLDPKARARVKSILRRLHTEGRTMLLTSHSLADIEEICDDMLVLHRGTFAFSGAPDVLREYHGGIGLEQAFLKCIEASCDG